jgi:aerobic C4-dicarboxylate transport protein
VSILKRLYVQVLIGIVAGILLGLLDPSLAVKMRPLGDGFIALLRLFLAPIIFLTVVHGLASVREMRKLGRLGAKALLYFEVVTTLGLAFGSLLGNLLKPGVGVHASGAQATASVMGSVASAAASGGHFTAVNFFLSIIPSTMVGAFAQGDILQVLFLSVLAGVALGLTSCPDSVIVKLLVEGQTLVFRMLDIVMRLAPLGAFGAIASAIGANGGGTVVYLGKLVLIFYAGCLVFMAVICGVACYFARTSLWKLLRLLKDEILIVIGTASGEVVFPRLVLKLEQAGCDEAVVGFVLPAAYSFNLNGTAIYMSLAVVFIAQATDTPFTLAQQLAVFGVLMLTSKGGTTVAGGAFVKLAATLQTVRSLPLIGLTFLFGVDRLMATAIAVTNVIGNAVAVVFIAHSEKAFIPSRLDELLDPVVPTPTLADY